MLLLILILLFTNSCQQIFENSETIQKTNSNKFVLKILLIFQEGQESISNIIKNITNTSFNENIEIVIEEFKIKYAVSNNKSVIEKQLCEFYENGCNLIFDITWYNQNMNIISSYAQKLKMPYLKIDVSLGSTFKIIESYLTARNATDVTMIFENMDNVAEAICYSINNEELSMRLTMLNGMQNETIQRITETNFVPSFYVLFASSQNMNIMLHKFNSTKLLTFPERLVLAFLDVEDNEEIKSKVKEKPVSIITYDIKNCCTSNNNTCKKCPLLFNIKDVFLQNLMKEIVSNINELNKYGSNVLPISKNCSSPYEFSTKLFYEFMNNSKQNTFFIDENNRFLQQLSAIIELGSKKGNFNTLGKYNFKDGFVLEPGRVIKPNKKFYTVATGIATPWIYRELDPETNMTRLSGYCIDFIEKLAEVMNFEYELRVTDGFYGVKQRNGSWNGLVGGLMSGKIDIVVAPMTMTAEREEAIDFVTPIFATTGITIVTRKPVMKSSMFKFLIVLDIQVWLMIIVALIVTALMLFIINYCSPYSSRNMKYPHQCREFNMVECFWFALISFTPQGGGEPPMSLSGRILVGAYWIFVVLLLATFTANLSAFLTVERMQLQAPQYSLDQLIRQNRINYTVMVNSWPYSYFKNMRNTEKNIYKLWRSLALIKTTDEYRVWDYPIKEIYGNVLKAIVEAEPVKNVSEAYDKILQHTDGDFAFVHDYAEIRYALARTCYLVEVGKPFAERPYAVAVQQGSVLLEEVGQAMKQLQIDGYFEFLKDKYWRTDLRGECPDDDIPDGITVDSLGGAFIATIAVLLLAIISLIIEIFRGWLEFKNSNRTKPQPKNMKGEIFTTKKDFFEKDFRRNEAMFGAKNKSLSGFMEPQVTLASHLHPPRYNFKQAGVTVVRGNYFTVNSRKPLHPEGTGNMFLN